VKILLSGSAGYIGSVLGPYLWAEGHDVTGIDTGFYAEPLFYSDRSPQPPWRLKDIRRLNSEALDGFDAIIHLGGLCNDPVGELVAAVTRQINLNGTVRMAVAARDAGVARFINFSSCSIYGTSGDQLRDELSPTNPRTEYARCKLLSERKLSRLASDSFVVVSMRNATVFGPSPRMRFDLVLNNLAGLAWTRREVRLASDGTPWRPLIHVRDLARAAAMLLDAPANLVNGEVFNVGDDCLNQPIREIANEVCRAFPNSKLTLGTNREDERSYRVSFGKIRGLLGFNSEHDIQSGATELCRLFDRVGLTTDTFESSSFTRVKGLRTLISSGAVDENLYWRAAPQQADKSMASGLAA
jgi:nucleoside-diphosphate-sugar epimerase